MPFTILPISLILAAACAIINLWLGIRVGQVRQREKAWVGDAGSEPLIRRMRAQLNFVENVVFVLVLVALIELCTGSNIWLAILAGVFVAGRLLHPFGMDGWMPGRMIGATTTMLVQLALAVWAVTIPIVAHYELQRAVPTETVVPAG
ncbi:MAPEG family protein [Sphingomonas bacterium]|uniref:MAPEG family protein n=1 Tax=Sphingomonas bacterium TaxID=1895847 RepID=UPI001575DECE|nr:MAPEG family protein [Sphingomonas bacterium]